ncbi:interferon beta-like [Macrotis lagotis]|uniref:interferon beta-like n=1 Tax=Macrotis lagotis TaxID=92651 RepID=UPI003D69E5F9
MANRSILQLALLLVLFAGVSSKGLLHSYQRRTNQRSLSLLKEMMGNPPPECLKEIIDFKIPQEIVRPMKCQKENATMIILEMLQQIFLLFSSNNASLGVDNTIIEEFLNGIHVQMEHLETALEEEMEQNNITWESKESLLHLNNYYQRINDYLKNKEYSSCSWLRVQQETRLNFIILYKLTKCLKN